MDSCNSVISSFSQCLRQLIQVHFYVSCEKRTNIIHRRLDDVLDKLKKQRVGDNHIDIQRNKLNYQSYINLSLYIFQIICFAERWSSWCNHHWHLSSKKMLVLTLQQSKCHYTVTADVEFQRPLILQFENSSSLLSLTWDLFEAPCNMAKCVTSRTRVKGVRDMFLVSRAPGLFLRSGSPRMWPGLVPSLKQQISIR